MAQIAALVIEVPSNTVTKKQNQTLNVGINFNYVGPAQRIYFTAVVTQDTWYSNFDEIGSTKKVVYSDIPESSTPQGWIVTVSGLPLAGVEPKTTAYGVKVKAEGTFGTVEAGNKSCLYVQAPATVQLKAGWNEYRYEGAAISGRDLLASIKNYLIIAYYLQEGTNLWVLITDDLLVQPGYLLNINVSEDCTWTF